MRTWIIMVPGPYIEIEGDRGPFRAKGFLGIKVLATICAL